MPDTGSYVLSVRVAFGACLCCDGACGSEGSGVDREEVAVDFNGTGGALGLQTVYLVVILVCGMGAGQRTMTDKGGVRRTVVGRADMRSVDCSRYNWAVAR